MVRMQSRYGVVCTSAVLSAELPEPCSCPWFQGQTYRLSSNKDVVALRASVAQGRVERGMLVVRLLVVLMLMRSGVVLV